MWGGPVKSRSLPDWAANSRCVNELIGRNIGLTQDSCQCSNFDFAVHRYNTALSSTTQNDVASFLTNPYETETLKHFYDFRA